MEWVKLYATPPFYLDGALLRAGEAAEVLFCRALAHCGNVESRGRIEKHVLPMLCSRNAVARATALVREGLWSDEGDHYVIRSWDRLQDQHDAAALKRRQDRDRQREKRRRDRGDESSDSTAVTSRDSHADSHVTNRDSHAVDVEGEREKNNTKSKTLVRSAEFEAWYAAYPRKASPGLAAKAYDKALRRTDAATLLAGALRYRHDPNREDSFTKLPATWLNQDCWDDEPLPSRSTGTNRAEERDRRNLALVQHFAPTYEQGVIGA